MEELFSYILHFVVLAVWLQETWKSSVESLENRNHLLFLAGLEDEEQSRCGSQDVSIGLSPGRLEAWRAGN